MILKMHAYCGMSYTLVHGDETTCRTAAAKIIKRHRRYDGHVAVLDPGRRWELETPETACMVSDEDGVMEIQAEEEPEDGG